ncbi:hypothetical protein GO493_25775 [Chitinophaga sp. ysch24]|uniref:Abi-like protein n=1 Tax=Chitinophaga tropicalis TaxID=2683588 RepID=A0A7K1UBD3_9BACT|nr:Abi family protein [Chitinophaga tropicalis]MVT11699.1 hypothetical protein [Chitinophaga tropicalis]
MLSPYQKPTTTISQQITLLRKRGLVIPDEKIAEKYLTFVGYYRLAGYWQIYQSDKVNHIFHEGVTFRHITELYNFDRELRILLCDAIERIEIALRSIIVNTMCASHGPLWFTNPSLVEREDWYNENLSVINAELDRSMEEFIEPTMASMERSRTHQPGKLFRFFLLVLFLSFTAT